MGKEDWSCFGRPEPYCDKVCAPTWGSGGVRYSAEEEKQFRELSKMKMEDERYQQLMKQMREERKEEERKEQKKKRRISRINEKLFYLGFREPALYLQDYIRPIYRRTFTEHLNSDAKNFVHMLKSTDDKYKPALCKLYQSENTLVLLYLIPDDINTSDKLNDYIIQKEKNINWNNNRKTFNHKDSYLPFFEDVTINKLKDIIISRDLHYYTNMNAKKKDLFSFLEKETKKFKKKLKNVRIKLVFIFEKELYENYYWSKALNNIENDEEDVYYITEEGNMFDKSA